MNPVSILLLHGALGSAAQFVPLMHKLPAHWNIYSMDLPLHGSKAAAEGEYSIESCAMDIAEFLQQKNENMWIFGHSMGGYAALWLCAAQQNPLIKGIFTLGTKFKWSPEIAQREALMLNPDKIEQKVPAFAAALQSIHGDNWKYLCRATADMMQRLGQNPLLDEQMLDRVRIPVRFGLGDKDNMVSIEETIHTFRHVEGAELQIFPSMLHPYEKLSPDILSAAIIDFCSKK
jgi:pimeloyl-ACP methyl ester carboxylesterase